MFYNYILATGIPPQYIQVQTKVLSLVSNKKICDEECCQCDKMQLFYRRDVMIQIQKTIGIVINYVQYRWPICMSMNGYHKKCSISFSFKS